MQLPAQVWRIALFMGFKSQSEAKRFTPNTGEPAAFPDTACEDDSFTVAAKTREQAAYQALLNELDEIKQRLATARSHFEFETDFDLIEADIYHIRELETRFGHLMKLIKASYWRDQPA